MRWRVLASPKKKGIALGDLVLRRTPLTTPSAKATPWHSPPAALCIWVVGCPSVNDRSGDILVRSEALEAVKIALVVSEWILHLGCNLQPADVHQELQQRTERQLFVDPM